MSEGLVTLLEDKEIRDIVDRWFPVSWDSLTFAYKRDMREFARDFGYHIAAAQASKSEGMLKHMV